jgi:hypothetical protein
MDLRKGSGMGSGKARSKASGWIIGLALAAPAVTGCNNAAGDPAPKPAASSATDSTAGAGAATSQPSGGSGQSTVQPSGGGGQSTVQPSGGGGQSTVQAAVGTWITAIINGDAKQACLVMAKSPTEALTAKTCKSGAPELKQVEGLVTQLRQTFTPANSTGSTKAEVADVPLTGDKAVVKASEVTVDGQTLDKIVLSKSTGVQKADIKFDAAKIDGVWYVADFNIKIS